MAITAKGEATRARIVETAADLVLARGVGGTSLDDICAGTASSRSQLFHYFPNGKVELVGAISALQAERVLDAQRPHLERLDTWDEWDAWREAVVAHYRSQAHLGCPIGALVSEIAGREPALQQQLQSTMDRWLAYLEAGVTRMRQNGLLRAETDPRVLSLALFGALQGGLLLIQTKQSIEPLEAALDGALTILRAAAA